MISNYREMEMEWPACLNEYEKLVLRMNTPRVVIDNAACCTATLVKVDSARNHAFLLDTVQVLTDLDLSINKAYISSDGPYFMDVFHVTDLSGRKLADQSIISYIQQSIQTLSPLIASGEFENLAALELTGADRPGLLSEIFAVLADLDCPVAEAKVWTNNGRIASVISVGSDFAGGFGRVEARLRHVVQGTVISSRIKCHADRRLHQMMFADRDYEGIEGVALSVQNLIERGYSIVNVGCQDRPKLLFDVISTLTDMEYVVFHGNIDTDGDRANQEFYIRHADGTPIGSEAERQRVIQCLQAAIERRSHKGLRLELCTVGRQGTNVLSEVTRAFRENGLLVTRAEVSTNGETATNVFYVTDAAGQVPDASDIDAVRRRVGMNCCLQVKEEKLRRNCSKDRLVEGDGEIPSRAGSGLSSLGSLVLKNLYNLGLIRSCS